MTESSKAAARSKIWAVGVCILVATIVVMAYFMYEMNTKLESMAADARTNSTEQDSNTMLPAQQSQAADASWLLPDEPLDPDIWSPFHEMEAMQRRIERLFNDSFGRFNRNGRLGQVFGNDIASPRLDLTDQGDRFIARLDIPGSEDSQINVTVENQSLTVEAVSKDNVARQDSNGQILREERHVGTFRRQIRLPEPVNTDFDSEYKDGVLTVTLYKSAADDS